MDLPHLDHLRMDLADGILTVTLDRPDRLNAINHPLHQSIARAFDFACDCEDARVVVLTGAGRAINAAVAHALPKVFDQSLAYEGLTMLSEDHAEAKAAFLEKRKPVFRGR